MSRSVYDARRRYRPRYGKGPGRRGAQQRLGWAREQQCYRQLGKTWTIADMVRKDGTDVCYCCERPAVRWAYVNVWGSAYRLRMCHVGYLRWNGSRMDDLPQPHDCMQPQSFDPYLKRSPLSASSATSAVDLPSGGAGA